MQATFRELRTFAYQYHLLRRAGCRLDPRAFAADSARCMVFMHDWYWVPGQGETGRLAFCQAEILKHIDTVTAVDAFARLEACLDITARRLARMSQAGSSPDKMLVRQAPRYRADGTLYPTH